MTSADRGQPRSGRGTRACLVGLGAVLLVVGCAAAPHRSAASPAAESARLTPVPFPGQGGSRIDAVLALEQQWQGDWQALTGGPGGAAAAPPTPFPAPSPPSPPPASAQGGPGCEQTCRLSERICEAATKICAIAAEEPAQTDLGPRCERARDHCRKAARLCSGCGGSPPVP